MEAALTTAKESVKKIEASGQSEEVRALAMELNDARDDLTDELKAAKTKFVGLMPGWVPMLKGELVWDGRDLFYVRNGNWSPALSCSMEIRTAMADKLEPLYDDCTRKRP